MDKELEKEVNNSKQQITANTRSFIRIQDKAGNKSTATRTINLQKKKFSKGTSGSNSSNTKDIDNNEQKCNSTNTGVIYLTFDDGPSTDITPKILKYLGRRKIKAHFLF